MIKGHGDDAYQYPLIKTDFSSNICRRTDNQQALKAHLASHLDLIDHYPEPEAWSLERLIAIHHGIDPECVIATNGATDAIYLVAQAFASMPCRHYPPTFSEYADASRLYGMPDASRLCGMPEGDVLHWLCTPNNPTGLVVTIDEIMEKWRQGGLLVLDQSYEDYTDLPMLSPKEAIRMGRIIQLHSMTKTYGVPGLRIGYITTERSLADRLRSVLRPWSMNVLAIEAGCFLIEHEISAMPDNPPRSLRAMPDLQEARLLRQRLLAIEGLIVAPTDTNFMLCELRQGTAAQLKDALARRHGILIRDASNFPGLSPRHFRIASQSPQENARLVTLLSSWLAP
jgi:threonine-phosphate decarboxylase